MWPYSKTPLTLQILIVEDEENLALLQKRCLEKAGHRVFIADSGEKALQLLEQQKINVVLLDQKLPAMAGAEVFARIIYKGFDVSIVMITGHDDDHLAHQSLDFGADDYIFKDASLSYIKALPRIVKRCWKQHEIKREYHRLQKESILFKNSLETLIKLSDEFIFVIDKNNRILMVNDAMLNHVKQTREQIIGSPCYTLVHGKTKPIDKCPCIEMFQTGQPVTRQIYEPLYKSEIILTSVPVYGGNNQIEQIIHIIKKANPSDKRGDNDIQRKSLEIWQ